MRVMVIAPHMDDEVLGVGGTIARHVDHGDTLTVCIVANRAYDHTYHADDIQNEMAAARSAQGVLGYQQLSFLNLPDEQLDRSLRDVIVPLESVYNDVQPEIVYLCHRGDTHQDHNAVFRAGMIVCRALSAHRASRVLCYEVPSSTDQCGPFAESTFTPNFYVDIEPYLTRKTEALRCYQRELRDYPHPRSPEGLEIYARKRGTEVRLRAAEAFMIVRDLWL